jgi:hypothetical protein
MFQKVVASPALARHNGIQHEDDPPLCKQNLGDFQCADKSVANQEPADAMVSTIKVDSRPQGIASESADIVDATRSTAGLEPYLPLPFLGKEMEVDPQREKN